MLTDCAAHPEARCVATQATHRVGTRRTTWLSPLWAVAKGFHGPQASTSPGERASPEKRGLRSLALTRDGAPAACEPSLTYHPLLVCRSCSARCQAASSPKTPRYSMRTRAACSTRLDTTSWEGQPRRIEPHGAGRLYAATRSPQAAQKPAVSCERSPRHTALSRSAGAGRGRRGQLGPQIVVRSCYHVHGGLRSSYHP